MKEKYLCKNILVSLTLFGVFLSFIGIANAFAIERQFTVYTPAGFFSGILHGLLAPWSLIARWFINNVAMYAIPNSGWFYDLGFLIGIVFSLPIGWAAAIISVIGHLFF